MQKGRVILITSIIFVLLLINVHPSNVAAQEEMFQNRYYDIYDDSGDWCGSFELRLRVNPIPFDFFLPEG